MLADQTNLRPVRYKEARDAAASRASHFRLFPPSTQPRRRPNSRHQTYNRNPITPTSDAQRNIDFRHPRGLKRAAIDQLASCEWIRHHRHCLITGPTGVGKSYLACALAHKACREGFRALYYYGPKLFRELNMAQADGSLTRVLKKLARVDLLLVDDWSLTQLQPDQYRLFLEILDDRIGATLLTSQYAVNTWHELIGDPTIGDAILDRVAHNAYLLDLDGGSMRKKNAKKT